MINAAVNLFFNDVHNGNVFDNSMVYNNITVRKGAPTMQDYIKPSLDYIEQNLKTDITEEELAQMTGYSNCFEKCYYWCLLSPFLFSLFLFRTYRRFCPLRSVVAHFTDLVSGYFLNRLPICPGDTYHYRDMRRLFNFGYASARELFLPPHIFSHKYLTKSGGLEYNTSNAFIIKMLFLLEKEQNDIYGV
jgi:hypothetical protein